MLLRLGVLVCLLGAVAESAVQRIHVKERSDLAGGASFGKAGPYERIAATVVFHIDPKLKQNRGIVDLELAPVDADGLVEFTADLLVLKPRDPAKGNGTALVDVVNRGRILSMSMFNRGTGSLDPQTQQELGDGFLMQHGFTVVAVGWQFDTPALPGRLGLKAPRLKGEITGLVRGEFVPDKSVNRFPLGDRDHVPYPVADEKDPANRLTVSDGPGLPRREIPRAQMAFCQTKRQSRLMADASRERSMKSYIAARTPSRWGSVLPPCGISRRFSSMGRRRSCWAIKSSSSSRRSVSVSHKPAASCDT